MESNIVYNIYSYAENGILTIEFDILEAVSGIHPFGPFT